MARKLEEEVLEILEKRSGEYVSGSAIAKRLGVTRAAVSRAVASLRRRGLIVESHPRLGYRLVPRDDLSEARAYLADLGTEISYAIRYLPSTTSTQDVAKSLADGGAPEGTVVLAEEMSAGRGRLGRKWHAGPGGLWMTAVLRPEVPPARVQLFSLLSSVAVARAIERVCRFRPEVKWPNDVLAGGRKVCGILLEASVEADSVRYLLLGVGINVNNEIPAELREVAVSLKEVVGAPVPRLQLLRAFLVELDALYGRLREGDVEGILREWRSYASTLGRRVRAVYRDEVVEGLAVDVEEDGSLVLKLDDGSTYVVRAGDLVHLR